MCEFPGSYWKPRYEGDIVLGAIVEDGFALAVGDVVFVLHADDVDDFAGLFDFGDGNFAQADEADFTLCLQALDGAEGVFNGDFGVDAMELPEVESVFFEPAKAHFYLLGEIFGAAYGKPAIWALAG